MLDGAAVERRLHVGHEAQHPRQGVRDVDLGGALSGTSPMPSSRAASAGNSETRSGVAVNRMLITSSCPRSLRSSTALTSSRVASSTCSRSSASTCVAPRMARTAMYHSSFVYGVRIAGALSSLYGPRHRPPRGRARRARADRRAPGACRAPPWTACGSSPSACAAAGSGRPRCGSSRDTGRPTCASSRRTMCLRPSCRTTSTTDWPAWVSTTRNESTFTGPSSSSTPWRGGGPCRAAPSPTPARGRSCGPRRRGAPGGGPARRRW